MSAIVGTGDSGRVGALIAQAQAQAQAGPPSQTFPSTSIVHHASPNATLEESESAIGNVLQLPGNKGPSDSTSFWLGAHIRQTPGAQEQLQSAANDGMSAAREMGTTSEVAFMKAHPDIGLRYDNDPAFKAGFDAYTWAEQHSPADVAKMNSGLDAATQQLAAEIKEINGSMMAMMQRA